jgi:ABC-type lipoprotein export system ATPase subunit
MKLRLEGLQQVYQSPSGEARTVLAIDEWTCNEAAHLLLRGVSGSGKTTLFNILAGLMCPTSGAVWFDTVSLYALPEERRDRFRARMIGYVFQNHYLLNSFTALENVTMPLAFAGQVPRPLWKRRACELLDQVGLADYGHYHPRQLSTGQRLRVSIARALANHPPVLLADEPTAALDAETSTQVMRLMQDTCRAQNALLLVASHDPALSSSFDRVLHLHGGRLTEALPA